jgi:hypothetical protein
LARDSAGNAVREGGKSVDAEILAEYKRLTGELRRNREALAGLLDRIKQPDGSLKLTKEADASWDRLDKEYDRDRKALRKLVARKAAAGKSAAKPAAGKPAAS